MRLMLEMPICILFKFCQNHVKKAVIFAPKNKEFNQKYVWEQGEKHGILGTF